MTLRIEVGFDTTQFGQPTITVGATPAPIDDATYCHRDLSSVVGTGLYTDFAGACQQALLTAGLSASLSVTYVSATGAYNLTPSGSQTVTLNTAARQLLGFSGDPGTISSAATSDVKPYFLIDSAMGGKTANSDDYEARSYSEDAEAEDGSAYGIASTGRAVYADWVCAFEPRTAVYIREATAAVPWTWEHFYQHASVVHPFMVEDDYGDQTVHRFRAGFDRFKPRRVQQDWDELHDVDMKTRVMGRL